MQTQRIARMKRQKGFTLVELMVVIAIIGILAAISVPRLFAYVRSSQTTEVSQYSARIASALQSYVDGSDPASAKAAINALPDLTGDPTTATEITTLIPELVLPGDAHFTYKIATDVATGGPQKDELVYCIIAKGKKAPLKPTAGVQDGLVFISSANTTASGWNGNINNEPYRSGSAATTTVAAAGGYCTTAGAASPTYN